MSGSIIQENAKTFRTLQLSEEVAGLGRILGAYTAKVNLKPDHKTVPNGELARSSGEAIAYMSASMYDMQAPYEVTGADFALSSEIQRIRKDMTVARTTHKRLMQGIMETLYRRKLKADKLILKLGMNTTCYK